MVYYPRVPVSEEDKTLSLIPDSSIYLQQSHGVDSVSANRNLIESRKFDVLLYLDLFMASEMRFGVEARARANRHARSSRDIRYSARDHGLLSHVGFSRRPR